MWYVRVRDENLLQLCRRQRQRRLHCWPISYHYYITIVIVVVDAQQIALGSKKSSSDTIRILYEHKTPKIIINMRVFTYLLSIYIYNNFIIRHNMKH